MFLCFYLRLERYFFRHKAASRTSYRVVTVRRKNKYDLIGIQGLKTNYYPQEQKRNEGHDRFRVVFVIAVPFMEDPCGSCKTTQ